MKKSLLAIAVLFALATGNAEGQGKHRHQRADTVEAVAPADEDEALEAVSDTADEDYVVSVDAGEDADEAVDQLITDLKTEDIDNPFKLVLGLCMLGVGGVLVALFVLLVCLLFLALPVILLIVLLRYLMKRSEINAELARKAMEEGREVPHSTLRGETEYDVFLWRKGVRNVSIGLGLTVLFLCMGAESLAGVGLLVACFGGGQMFVARTTGRKSAENKDNGAGGGDMPEANQF